MKKITAVFIALSFIIAFLPAEDAFAADKESSTVITLYALNPGYCDILSIPDGYATEYSIQLPDNINDYHITVLGETVINENSVIKPKASEVTVIGALNGSASVVSEYTFGVSTVVVFSNSEGYCKSYTFEVKDYSDVYVDEFIDAYIEKNIPDTLSIQEKLNKVGEFIASFDYNTGYQTLKSMLIYKKGGDCWASTDAAVKFCEHLGIAARVCSEESVSIFTGGHTYALASADGRSYIIEAGYGGKAPRPYTVAIRENPFSIIETGENACSIKSYLGSEAEIIIPKTIDGLTVTGLESNCFYYADRYIQGGIKKITLPETIETIGASCFYDCADLEELNVPASVNKIEMGAFINCKELKLNIDESNRYFTAEDGIIYTKDKKEIVCAYSFKKDCVIPEGVEQIGDCAFYNSEIDSIVFPSTLKDIGYKAFAHCIFPNISIVLPESVSGIGYGAFYASGIADITILNKSCVINNTEENDLYKQESGCTVDCDNIFGYSGSSAELYAEKYDRNFAQPCRELINNGRHSFNQHTCADKYISCASCSLQTENKAQHNYVYSGLSYFSNTHDPFLYLRCSVCGDETTEFFYLSDMLPGDPDIDGKVTAADARKALRTAVGIEYNNGLEMFLCNVDGDDRVSASDARLILRAAVGLEVLNKAFA